MFFFNFNLYISFLYQLAIKEDCICTLKGHSKNGILLELIDLIKNFNQVNDIEELKKNILEREGLVSTGIGLGVAVPHVTIGGIKDPVIAIGISHEGIPDYETIDDKIVKIVVMVIGDKNRQKEYIKLLAKTVSQLNREDVVQRLLSAKNSTEIYKIMVKKHKK